MNLLRYYLTRTVIGTILLVILALMGLQLFILFLGQLSDIGKGEYGLLQAAHYVLLSLPQQLYQLFPMAGLLGILLGLGVLANHSELIVMQAAGVSIRRITWIVLQSAIAMIVLVTLVGELAAMPAKRVGDQQKTLAISSGKALPTGRGTWIRDGQHFLHIRTIVSAEHLIGISRYTFNKAQQLISASYADHAYYEPPHWVFFNVQESRISPKAVSSQHQDKIIWDLSLSPQALKMTTIEPRDMSLKQLYQTMAYQQKNGLNSDLYQLAFWRRVWQPVAALVMMWLAIPFIFGPLRSVSIGLRLLTGVGVGFSFHILNELLGSMSLVFRMPPFLMTMLPTLLFAFIGWWLLRRSAKV